MLIIAKLSQSVYPMLFHHRRMIIFATGAVFCLALLSRLSLLRSTEAVGISILFYWFVLGATFFASRNLLFSSRLRVMPALRAKMTK
jgi:hypothetical protein